MILLPLLAWVKPVMAIVSGPDSSANITNIHVNRNILTTSDWLIYAEYNIPYASLPAIRADQCFIFRLMSPSGNTEIASILPYSYPEFNNGYNKGNIFFYLADTSGLIWGSAYIIRILENPAQFIAPIYWDQPIPSDNYSNLTSQSANKNEIAANIRIMASTLATTYSHTLTDIANIGVVLTSPYGETYYRGVCNGIQYMAPSLFLVQSTLLDMTSTNWTNAQAEAWENQNQSNWVGAAENATAGQFRLTHLSVPTFVFTCLIAIAIAVLSSLKFKRIEPGLVAISVWLICALLVGWIPGAIVASIYQLMGIYTGYVWFFERA